MTSVPSEDSASLIRKHLFAQREQIYEVLLLQLKNWLTLFEDGSVLVRNPGRLRQADAINLYLVGRLLAQEAGTPSSAIASAQEVASALGIDKDVCVARLSDLKKEGLIEVPEKGQYRAVLSRVAEWVEGALPKAEP